MRKRSPQPGDGSAGDSDANPLTTSLSMRRVTFRTDSVRQQRTPRSDEGEAKSMVAPKALVAVVTPPENTYTNANLASQESPPPLPEIFETGDEMDF